MKKRIVSMLLAAMMAISTSAVAVSAESNDTNFEQESNVSYNEETGEYIIFIDPENPNSRFDDYGFFNFEITNFVDSEGFRVNSTSTNIAVITDQAYSGRLTVELRDVRYYPDEYSTWGYYHESYDFPADGESHVQTYTGLSTSNTYYLHISAHGSYKKGTGLITAYA